MRIIPTQQDKEKEIYDEILLLSELMETSDGLIDTLKAKFIQIDSITKNIRYVNKYNFPNIELIVAFRLGQSLSTIPQKIYAYVTGYMAQNWGKVYNSEGNKIIESLNYKFLLSPFKSNDPVSKMRKITYNMGIDTPGRALNTLLLIEKSKVLPQD